MQNIELSGDVPALSRAEERARGPQVEIQSSAFLRVRRFFARDIHVEELIALTGDYRVARAAFDEAVKRRPGRIVTLRQKTQLLADSRRSSRSLPRANN